MPDLDQIALDTVEAIGNIDPDKLKGGRVQAVAQAQCLVRDALRELEAECDALASRVDFMNQQNSAQQEQNDALAAHVERLRTVWDDLTAHATHESLLEIMERVFADAPATSLTRFKAGWQAGLMEQARRVRNYSNPHDVFEAIPVAVLEGELRRQAEETHDTP